MIYMCMGFTSGVSRYRVFFSLGARTLIQTRISFIVFHRNLIRHKL